jgi:hypothetical protein
MIKTSCDRPRTIQNASHQGFSFIELLISSTITFFLLLGAGQLVLHSMLFKQTSDETLKAAELMNDKLENLKSFSFDDVDADEEERCQSVDITGHNYLLRLCWSVEEASPGLKRIVITCFPENNPRRTVRSFLLLSNSLGF